MKSIMRIYINEDLCKGCGICIRLCPNKVLSRSDKLSSSGIYPPTPSYKDKCSGCRICEEHCPDMAIFIEVVKDVED